MGKKQTGCRKQRLNHLGQQMIWQLQETRALQVELSSSILPIAWRYRTIFAWFTSSWMHSLMVTSYHFGGGLLTKEVYAYSDRISCMYVYIERESVCVYVYSIYIYNTLIHTMCGKCQAQPFSWVSVSQMLAWYSPGWVYLVHTG